MKFYSLYFVFIVFKCYSYVTISYGKNSECAASKHTKIFFNEGMLEKVCDGVLIENFL